MTQDIRKPQPANPIAEAVASAVISHNWTPVEHIARTVAAIPYEEGMGFDGEWSPEAVALIERCRVYVAALDAEDE